MKQTIAFALAAVCGTGISVSAPAQTAPAAVRTKTPACAGLTPEPFVLAAPVDGSTNVPLGFKTIYIAIAAKSLAAMPAVATERVLLVDDLGSATEAGVLHPSTRDDLPSDLPTIAATTAADASDLAYSSTWVPGLRASTHYTAVLARLDENNCVFARLGEFTTGAAGAL